MYDKRRISFCIFAAVYKEYYESHTLPDGVDMTFTVPKKDFVETSLLMNKLLAENIKPLCQRASRHLHHSRMVFGMFFQWMHKNIRYTTPFPTLCICSVISHFVLHYFDIGCYRFSLFAAEFMAEVLGSCYPEAVESFNYAPFGGFRTFCDLLVSSVEFGDICSWKVNGKDYQLAYPLERFPKHLLRLEIRALDEDTSEDEHSENEHYSTVNKETVSNSPNQRFSVGKSPSIKSPNSPNSTDSTVPRRLGKNLRESVVCKHCNMDCRCYLKIFVSEFKNMSSKLV